MHFHSRYRLGFCRRKPLDDLQKISRIPTVIEHQFFTGDRWNAVTSPQHNLPNSEITSIAPEHEKNFPRSALAEPRAGAGGGPHPGSARIRRRSPRLSRMPQLMRPREGASLSRLRETPLGA